MAFMVVRFAHDYLIIGYLRNTTVVVVCVGALAGSRRGTTRLRPSRRRPWRGIHARDVPDFFGRSFLVGAHAQGKRVWGKVISYADVNVRRWPWRESRGTNAAPVVLSTGLITQLT